MHEHISVQLKEEPMLPSCSVPLPTCRGMISMGGGGRKLKIVSNSFHEHLIHVLVGRKHNYSLISV